MDRFRTVVEISPSGRKISYHTPALFMGSCFTEEIGGRMLKLKFPVLVNPFGTLFNPASICDNLEILLSGKEYTIEDLSSHRDMWFSFSHYTGYNRNNAPDCLSSINESVRNASAFLAQCSELCITLGTAWSYVYRKTGKVVANCHKIPSSEFERKLLEPGDIIHRYDRLISALTKSNPTIRIIFTVSPVRHWKDGAMNNMVSKSILILVLHELTKKYPHVTCFPAYEIFMDELRDYRFYASDMLHPSESGSSYVWERFCDTFMDPETLKLIAEVQEIQKSLGHRPRNMNTPDYARYKENTIANVNDLTARYPFIDFSRELAHFTSAG
jgi:hypothetical protein